jgi:RimJ/RimL family protein N-acetyltransferase
MSDPAHVTLEGRYVRLEPLTREHQADLAAVALDPDLWRSTLTRIDTVEDLDAYIEEALSWQRAGTAIPFATVNRATGRAIGSTRFANIDAKNRHLEIGWTWLGREFHRKGFNTEAKLLMLGHAFERMDFIRVEFRVNGPNARSRRAVVRLGAQLEGILRHHTIRSDGQLIDWVYYSILREEWPAVRSNLERRLAAHAGV